MNAQELHAYRAGYALAHQELRGWRLENHSERCHCEPCATGLTVGRAVLAYLAPSHGGEWASFRWLVEEVKSLADTS